MHAHTLKPLAPRPTRPFDVIPFRTQKANDEDPCSIYNHVALDKVRSSQSSQIESDVDSFSGLPSKESVPLYMLVQSKNALIESVAPAADQIEEGPIDLSKADLASTYGGFRGSLNRCLDQPRKNNNKIDDAENDAISSQEKSTGSSPYRSRPLKLHSIPLNPFPPNHKHHGQSQQPKKLSSDGECHNFSEDNGLFANDSNNGPTTHITTRCPPPLCVLSTATFDKSIAPADASQQMAPKSVKLLREVWESMAKEEGLQNAPTKVRKDMRRNLFSKEQKIYSNPETTSYIEQSLPDAQPAIQNEDHRSIIVCGTKRLEIEGTLLHEITLKCHCCSSLFMLRAAHSCEIDDKADTAIGMINSDPTQMTSPAETRESGLEWLRDEKADYIHIIC